jgi:LysR family nitrogen assimilation transcriptional regulator
MEGSARHIEEWLITRQADVGIVVHPAGSTQLLEDCILTEELYLIGRHKIQEGGTIPLTQVCRLPLVLPLSPHGTRRLLERIAAQQKLTFRPVLEVDSPNTIRMLVATQELYTVHSLLAFGNDIEEKRVFATRISPAPIRSLAVATLRGEPLTSAARALAQHIRKLVRGTVSEPTTITI